MTLAELVAMLEDNATNSEQEVVLLVGSTAYSIQEVETLDDLRLYVVAGDEERIQQ